MHTTTYKFQLNQLVYIANPTTKEIQSGVVQQVTIDLFNKPQPTVVLVTDIRYIIKLVSGISCTGNVEVEEKIVYSTREDAIAALKY